MGNNDYLNNYFMPAFYNMGSWAGHMPAVWAAG
jgi:hypothetical protein